MGEHRIVKKYGDGGKGIEHGAEQESKHESEHVAEQESDKKSDRALDNQISQARQIYNLLNFSLKRTDDTFKLENNKIYTCNFKRAMKIFPDWRLVSIARWSPYDFKGSQFKQLAPPEDLHKAYKYKGLSKKDFIDIYADRVLMGLNPNDVYNALAGKVLCCWEPYGDFCHRHLVLEWLRIELGDDIIGGEV